MLILLGFYQNNYTFYRVVGDFLFAADYFI